jgi:hypothetical protein
MMVLDMRSRKDYHYQHLAHSINIPLDGVDDEFFTKFKPEKLDALTNNNAEKANAFKNRKRKFIFIIASQNEITEFFKDGFEQLFDEK